MKKLKNQPLEWTFISECPITHPKDDAHEIIKKILKIKKGYQKIYLPEYQLETIYTNTLIIELQNFCEDYSKELNKKGFECFELHINGTEQPFCIFQKK